MGKKEEEKREPEDVPARRTISPFFVTKRGFQPGAGWRLLWGLRQERYRFVTREEKEEEETRGKSDPDEPGSGPSS